MIEAFPALVITLTLELHTDDNIAVGIFLKGIQISVWCIFCNLVLERSLGAAVDIAVRLRKMETHCPKIAGVIVVIATAEEPLYTGINIPQQAREETDIADHLEIDLTVCAGLNTEPKIIVKVRCADQQAELKDILKLITQPELFGCGCRALSPIEQRHRVPSLLIDVIAELAD